MSENVKVPYGKGSDTATLLLAAAEELNMEPGVVRTTMHGFEVPEEVASKAGVDTYDPDEDFNKEIDEARSAAAKQEKVEAPGNDMTLSRSGFEEQAHNTEQPKAEAPAKKAAAKKAPAKKAAAKKTAAKNTSKGA